MTNPYSEFADAAPDDDALAGISQLARLLITAQKTVVDAEETLKEAKQIERELSAKALPEAMDAVGMESFTVDGRMIKVSDALRCSVPVANRDECYDWLEAGGNGGMVKRNVVVSLSCNQEGEAAQLVGELAEKYENVKTERKVEPSTLKKFIREELEAGREIDLALFGAENFRIAKIK